MVGTLQDGQETLPGMKAQTVEDFNPPVDPTAKIETKIPDNIEKFGMDIVREDVTPMTLAGHSQKKRYDFIDYISPEAKDTDIANYVANRNQYVIDNAPMADQVPGGMDIVQQQRGWYADLYTPEELQKIKDKGPIGMIEAYQRLNKWEMLPWLNGVTLVEDIHVIGLMKKADDAPGTLTPKEESTIKEYLRDMAEVQERGYSIGGGITNAGLRMPAYAIEFAAAVGSLGATAGPTAGKVAGKVAIKKGIGKMLKGGLKMTANPKMFHRTAKAYNARRLNDSITFTDKGAAIFAESEEKKATTVFKAFGDTWIENSSELAGATLFKPVFGAVGRKLPKGFMKGFKALAEKSTSMKWSKAVAEFGYDGILEEMGEERLGAFLSTALNLDAEEGYSTDQFLDALFIRDKDAFLTEVGVIGIYGGVSIGGAALKQKIFKKRQAESPKTDTKALLAEVEKIVGGLSEAQIDAANKAIVSRETESDIAEYEQVKENYKAMVSKAVPTEQVDTNMAIIDAFVNTTAVKTGTKRADIFRDMSLVQRGGDTGGLGQEAQSNRLVAMHNLTEENLGNVNKIGGLPVPSVAIGKQGQEFTSFGEITLIGNTELIKPSATSKVFNADIYSPRYPKVTYDVSNKSMDALRDKLKNTLGENFDKIDRYEIEDDGKSGLARNRSVRLAYLKESGKIKEVYETVEDIDPMLMIKFKELIKDQRGTATGRGLLNELIDSKDGVKKVNDFIDAYLKSKNLNKREFDSDARFNIISNVFFKYKRAIELEEKKQLDVYETEKASNFDYNDKGFKDYVDNLYSTLEIDEKIFKGFTPGGSKKYSAHTLDNVVKELKKGLQDAEGFSYGLGNVRANVAKQFKSLAQIQKDRDSVVGRDQFEQVKQDTDALFEDITASLDLRERDNFLEVLKDGVKRKVDLKAEFKEYGFDAIDMDKLNLLLSSLKEMPTEYFEAKIRRTVDIGEFSGAVVPYNISNKTRKILENKGIPYREIGKEENRADVVASFTEELNKKSGDVLFQGRQGSYQPDLDLISLFETADRSTFIHESAHAFLQYYLKNMPTELDAVFKFAGVANKPLDKLSPTEYRRVQESFARGFETYLAEGKAPSAKLADVFETFKNWMLEIYENLTGMLKINNEIRGFFDQMLEYDMDVSIDSNMTAEIPEVMTLFQDAQKKLEDLAAKIKDIKAKYRNKITTITEVQKELTAIIKGLPLEANDKAKFISSIKEVKTRQQLQKMQDKIANRGSYLYKQQQKRIIDKSIKKELDGTKPQKKGSKTVGRYQYADNLIFKDIREYSKYNQEQAISAINAFPVKEIMEESDLLKIKYLEYKANGMKGSVELHSQVLQGIQNAKQLATEIDDAVMFEKKFNRQEMKDTAAEAIKTSAFEIKEGTLKGGLLKKYVGSIANIKSMLNTLGGAKLVNMFNMDSAQADKFTKSYMTKDGLREAGKDIYGKESDYDFDVVMDKLNEKNYDILDKRFDSSDKISKQTIMTLYNWNKNAKTSELMIEQFGQEQLDAIFSELTEQDMAYADYIMEVVQSYGEDLNRKHIENTGIDQGRIDNYFPRSSEHMQDLNADIKMQGETPSSSKARATGKVFLKPTPIMNLAMRHIDQAEHTINVTDTWKSMRRTFDDPMVKRAIVDKIGTDGYQSVIDLINENSLNQEVARIDEIMGVFNKAIGNWVVSKIALNPTVFIKQLGSMSNYAENMPTGVWTKGMTKSLLNAKATKDYMFKNSDYLKARFGSGNSEAMMQAIKNAESMAKKQIWTKGLSSMVRMGDIGAIIYGGHAYVEYLQTEAGGNLTEAEAFSKFEQVTRESQQSGLASDIGLLQARAKGAVKMFTAFKNTSMQYTRKVVDAHIALVNGDITKEQYAKTMAIYLLVQPMIYGASGAVMKSLFMLGEDDEDEAKDRLFDYTMKALLTSPTNAIPLLSDAHKALVDMAVAKIKGEKYNAYGRDIFSLPVLGDVEKSIKGMYKLMDKELDDITIFDVIDSFGIYAEIGVGAPIGQWSRIVKNRMPKKTKTKSKGI